MSKKLAIKGHTTRGDEVIKLLEMMGGVNADLHKGNFPEEWKSSYYIYGDNTIQFARDEFLLKLNFRIFTLEEFLEKYPFMVGDKVNVQGWKSPGIILRMHIKNLQIVYDIAFMEDRRTIATDVCVECIKHYCKETQTNKNEMAIFITDNINLKNQDKVEIKLGDDWEIKEENGKTYAVRKKPVYPKTYEECCEVLMGKTNFSEFNLVPIKYSNTTKFDNSVSPDAPHIKLFNNLYKIVICCDAYWKIAGEEMDLDKPWKPDWKNTKNVKYVIATHDDIITKMYLRNENAILAFPTEEMRDAFYENFKDLIESCKELL